MIIYTGGFWRGPLGNLNLPFFGARPLWLAAYVATPVVPASWARYTFWQYSEGQHNGPATIPGVRPCDQDKFEGTEEDLAALCSAAPSPAPGPIAKNPADAADFPGTAFVWPQTPPAAGPAVSQWQQRMRELGFSIATDGVYGPQSKAACLAFQKDHGLSADGIVGPATWQACFGGRVEARRWLLGRATRERARGSCAAALGSTGSARRQLLPRLPDQGDECVCMPTMRS